MYKRETTEYDTDFVKKYDEDLNTTLYSCVARYVLSSVILPGLAGGSVLCRQRSIRHRHPFEAPERPERLIRGPLTRSPPHSQSIRHPRRDPRRHARPGRPTERDRHRHYPYVRKPFDLPASYVRRDAGKAVAEPVPAEFGRVDDRALRRPSTQMRWAR